MSEQLDPNRRNIKLTLRYDGTDFHGFQRQARRRTVQEEIEKAILRVTGEKVAVVGAGRTDAGVHALGQVVNFWTSAALPVEQFPMALNAYFAREIAVYRAEEASAGFNAQQSAKRKTYAYTIWVSRYPHPLLRLYSYHQPKPLDAVAMGDAGRALIGTHDFTSFWSAGSVKTVPVRTVYDLSCRREERDGGELIVVSVIANGFLYRMVRNIVGFLMEVGRGRYGPEDAARVLAAKDRQLAGRAAQPHGLCLVEVVYDEVLAEQVSP